jgi:hypothetical protein
MKSNISSFFGKLHLASKAKHGHSLVIDELNLKERGRYLPASNAIVGLCREHGHVVDHKVTSVDAVHTVASALSAGTCHLGKEATVCGIAPFSKEHYHVVPVLVSPTCKTKTAEAGIKWLSEVLDEWKHSSDGKAKWGPIWSVASDGDATRRKAFHGFLLSQQLEPDNPLYSMLSQLPLMNLYTGAGDVTADFDPKHLLKREIHLSMDSGPSNESIDSGIATQLRAPDGCLVASTLITWDILAKELKELPELDSKKVADLIDPADHQNVPKAVALLSAISQIAFLPTQGLSPADLKT